MAFMDRTTEFNNVAESVRAKQLHHPTKPAKRTALQQKSQFALAASKIGKDISDTSETITKLTKLIKKVSPFDDHKVEIEELTFMIKQSIQNLNKDIIALKDNSRAASSNKQNTAHSDTIVTFLNTKLASTTKCFKDTLELQTENIKENSRKMGIFGGNTGKGLTPIKSSTLHKYDNLPDSPQRSPGGEVVVAMPMMMQVQQEDYTTTRATAVENIERTIAELGGIFQQLANLVAEQGDMLQRIDENIDNSQVHVDRAQNELLKMLYNVSSSRMLIVKLFFILIVFAVIFIVFFV